MRNLAFVVVGGDSKELSLSYGYNESRSTVPYCTQKNRIPNAFTRTAFTKCTERSLQNFAVTPF